MSLEMHEKFIYNHKSKELFLSQCDLTTLSTSIVNAFGHCTEYLDLSHNRISNLKWLYKFENLKYLILDSNRLHERHFQKLHHAMKEIKLLMLNKNEFNDLNTTIKLLSQLFPNLEYLSLHGNAICPDGLALQPFSEYVSYEYDYYRSQILNALSNLKFLDHSHVEREFIGSMPQMNTRIFTFAPKMLWAKLKPKMSSNYFSPLPNTTQALAGYHCGLVRKISNDDKFYHSENSEGNRYICNNDL